MYCSDSSWQNRLVESGITNDGGVQVNALLQNKASRARHTPNEAAFHMWEVQNGKQQQEEGYLYEDYLLSHCLEK